MTIWWGDCVGCNIWGGKGGGGKGEGGGGGGGGCWFCDWEEGPALGCSGQIFLAAPSPLSLLLFRFTLVSMSSICCLFFFLFFFGDIGGTAAAGVFGVAVDVVGGAAGFCVFGVGVAGVGDTGAGADVTGAGVAGGSGVAATAAVGGAFICFWGGDDDGLFSPFFRGSPPLSGYFSPALLVV